MRAGRMILAVATLLLLANVASAQSTQPAAGEIRRSTPASSTSNPAGPSATRVALSLAAVLALIVVIFMAGRRFLPRGSFGQHAVGGGGAVHVLARTPISPKQRVILLQVGRRILVVADGAGANLTTLCEITDADEAAALISQLQIEKSGSSFTTALNSAMERFRTAQHDPSREPREAREPQPNLDAMREEIEGLAKRVRGMAR